MNLILTIYPLSRSFQERIDSLVGPEALRLSVGELRQRPFVQMLKYLRSLRVDRVFLPIEDENGSALSPVLKLLAGVVPARYIYLVGTDMQLQRISRLATVRAALSLIHASVAAYAAVVRARHEVADLLAEQRVVVGKTGERKVLYLNANLWFGVKAGGSVGHISGVVNALLLEGSSVDFVSAGGRLLVNKDATYTQLQPPAHFGFPWEYNYYRFHFNVVEQVKRLVERQQFDFIYQRLSIANYSGVVLSRLLHIPLILEYNGSEAWIAKNWGRPLRDQVLAEQVEESNLRHAHLVVTISDVLRDELLGRGVPAERIVSYPNCIDPEMFDPRRFTAEEVAALRYQHGIPTDAVVVSFIGTFGQWHGAEVLAEAIRQLIDSYQGWIQEKKVRFLLVGDGLKMREVRAALGNHAEGPFVVLAGLVPQYEAPLYLAASDILSSPHVPNSDGSRFFGSPTKLFEYMAMGKAIVASDLDQIGDVLSDCVHAVALPTKELPEDSDSRLAVLCSPGSPTELIAGIRFLVNAPSWRSHLGRNARLEVLARYTWKHHVNAIRAGIERCEGSAKDLNQIVV